MAAKRTFSVTVDGETYTRTSAHEYTHVVIGRGVVDLNAPLEERTYTDERTPLQWSKSEANATKGAATYMRYGFRNVSVVPVGGSLGEVPAPVAETPPPAQPSLGEFSEFMGRLLPAGMTTSQVILW